MKKTLLVVGLVLMFVSNVFAESITITWSKPVQTCIVYDDAGRMIYRKNNLNSLPVKRLQIVTSNWAAANYTVQCISTDGTAHSAQAIKLRN